MKRTTKLLDSKQMLQLLRKKVLIYIENGGSQRQWAIDHGIDAAYLSRMLNGERGLTTKTLDALGFEKVVTVRYREKRNDG